MEIGALSDDDVFMTSGEFYWREDPYFMNCQNDDWPDKFCDAIILKLLEFTKTSKVSISDIITIGFPFPGPQINGLCFSNNLTSIFKKGVALSLEIQSALLRQFPAIKKPPEISVIFDAKCDASGELFHIDGRLWGKTKNSMVLNLGTGIAAAFINNGKVLVSDSDFKENIGIEYDCNSGQLGRHLWFQPSEKIWSYHYMQGGKTPAMGTDFERMTDRLSGPVLAVRLLDILIKEKALFLLKEDHDFIGRLYLDEVLLCLEETMAEGFYGQSARRIRLLPYPFTTWILIWADQKLLQPNNNLNRIICKFGLEVARELGYALLALSQNPEWERYTRHIILTGGIGINFLASSDNSLNFSFLNSLQRESGISVIRSKLKCAVERESYMFYK